MGCVYKIWDAYYVDLTSLGLVGLHRRVMCPKVTSNVRGYAVALTYKL